MIDLKLEWILVSLKVYGFISWLNLKTFDNLNFQNVTNVILELLVNIFSKNTLVTKMISF